MSNRLDIELTSVRSDGTYTWRAAGARQPKGVIDSTVLSGGAKVGDVLRVEAEIEIDGITILAVLPPKEKAAPSGRIELLGSTKPIAAVTTALVSEGGRGRGGDRRDLLDSPRRGDKNAFRDRRPGRGGEGQVQRRPGSEAAPSGRPALTGAGRSPRAGGSERPSERRPRLEGAAAERPPRTSERHPRTPGTDAKAPGAPGGETGHTGARPSVPRRTPPRFEPGTANRDLLIAGLPPEQQPIAERLASGGIPAVRRAIATEQERARAESRPDVNAEAIFALAEQLASAVKQATWLDRAEAAAAKLDQISLRDLRTTVVAAAPRDETGRELERKLRGELENRVNKLRSNWEEQIVHALEEGRVLQALRFSAQPPEPTARFPAALVDRLATSASAAMTTTAPAERWLAILEAAVASPIRRQIHPTGLPEDPSGLVLRKAREAAGSLPALAPMLGLPMPPPPKPIRPAHPTRPVHSSRPARPPRPAGRPQPQVVATGVPPSAGTSPSEAAAASPERAETRSGGDEVAVATPAPVEGSRVLETGADDAMSEVHEESSSEASLTEPPVEPQVEQEPTASEEP